MRAGTFRISRLRRRVRAPWRPHRSAASPPLVLLLAVSALLGIGWAVSTAPFEGPDEIDHFSYAQYLAETGHTPSRAGGSGSQSSQERLALTQLNLYATRLDVTGRPNWSAIDRTTTQLAGRSAPSAKDGSGPTSTANYPPLYYAYVAAAYRLSPWTSLLERLFVMRLATVVLLVGTVAVTWLIACELFAQQWVRVVATGMVALQPKMSSLAGVVNADMMLAFLAAACLLFAIRLVRRGPSLGAVVWPSLFAALGVLTHPRGLFLPPFVVVAAVVAATKQSKSWRSLLLPAGAVAVILAVGLGLAVAATHSKGGASTGAYGAANPAAGFNVREFLSYLWQFYLPKLTFMGPRVGPPYGYRQVFIETYFGSFAGFTVNYRPIVYDALQVGGGLGLAALYATVAARWKTLLARWPVVLIVATFFASLMGLLHVVSYQNLRGTVGTGDPVITGRYLLSAITLYGVAIAWVASSLPRRLGPIAGALVLGLSALLAVGGIAKNLVQFYA